MAILQLRCLGGFELRCDDQPLPKPATIKSQSLLVYLAFHRQTPFHRDQLAALFWGDRPEDKARRSLSTALWHIRSCLPDPELILSDAETVRFDPGKTALVDADAFVSQASSDSIDQLRSAIALYRGSFLEGFYDDWIITERYRLDALFLEALARLMIHQETCNDHQGALATALCLLDKDPLREDAHRLVMRLYCRLGRRNEALTHYQDCRELIRAELGVEPMAETTGLYQAIQEGRFAGVLLPGSPHLEIPPLSIPAVSARSPLDTAVLSPMVGRETETAFLEECWKETGSRRGRLVLVGGEAGVGKTRLVEEFADRLRWQGSRVLWGRCYEFERLLPYQPVAEALRTVLPALPVAEKAGFPAWVLSAVSQLVPESLAGEAEAAASAAGPDEQTRLFSGVTQFLSRLSMNGALLVVLEDLHWASESTLQLLHYLAGHLVETPVLMVGTYRLEAVDPAHPLLKMQGQLIRNGTARALRLRDLSAENVETMIVEMSGNGDAALPLASRLHAETEGNPFFLIETIKGLFEKGIIQLEQGRWKVAQDRISHGDLPLPESITEAVQARLHGLSGDVRDALQLAAVLGGEFDFDVLRSVLGRDDETTLQALDVLLRQRLIEEGRGLSTRDYVFTHHKIQEIAYEDIPRHRRQHLHARAAAALEQLHAAHIDLFAGEVAYHYERCRSLDPVWNGKAVDFLVRAGDRVRDLSAFRDAVDYYERAVALLKEMGDHERTALTLIKLGQTYHIALDFDRSRRAYDEAFKSSREARKLSGDLLPPAPHALRVQWREPETLDPVFSRFEWSRAVIGQLFSGLTSRTGEGDVVPEAAHAWDILDSGRRYVFYLRQDATWSDGMPVTAQDFVHAWRRMVSPGVDPEVAELLSDIKGALAYHRGEISDPARLGFQAVDARTLRVELEKPNGFFLHILPEFFPVPRHVVEALGEAWAQPQNLVCNGAFLLEDWRHDQSLSLARNPRYAGHFPGNVERVELSLLPDALAQYELYEAGGLDVFDFWRIPQPERSRARYRDVNDFVSLPQFSTILLGLDLSRPPFNDVRVRRAMACAIDRQLLADVVMRGEVAPALGGMLPQGMPSYSAGIGIPFNPQEAQSLMAEAGYSRAGGRSFPVVKGRFPRGMLADFAAFLGRGWSELLGIDIEWEGTELDQFAALNQAQPPDVFIIGWGCEYPDPAYFFHLSHLQQHSGWHNVKFQALVDEAQVMSDLSKQAMLYRQADKLIIEEVPVIPLAYGRNLMLIKPWVKNYPVSPLFYWPWKEFIIEPH